MTNDEAGPNRDLLNDLSYCCAIIRKIPATGNDIGTEISKAEIGVVLNKLQKLRDGILSQALKKGFFDGE